ncbi:unnamed protein product [Plutella xylostella]|uniref:(diamondback moth) hypothetical protein n=1 Tax=Plutella xylostella TaxID=51655 RepID=A0A8S4DLB8_PLUXY|nr:unnamed protein product [Plutella xylostella]
MGDADDLQVGKDINYIAHCRDETVNFFKYFLPKSTLIRLVIVVADSKRKDSGPNCNFYSYVDCYKKSNKHVKGAILPPVIIEKNVSIASA